MSGFDLAASDAVADVVGMAEPVLASLSRAPLTASAFHWRNGLYVTGLDAVGEAEEIELTLASGAAVPGELAGATAPRALRRSGSRASTRRRRWPRLQSRAPARSPS